MYPPDIEAVFKAKYPEWINLISVYGDDGVPNIMPAGWGMITSHEPPMFAVSVSPDRFTHDLLLNKKQWVIGWPATGQGEIVRYLGTTSGRDVPDKVARSGLKTMPAKQIDAPLMVGIHSQIECEYVTHVTTGDHTIFIGKAVLGHCDGTINEKLLNFGNYYSTPIMRVENAYPIPS